MPPPPRPTGRCRHERRSRSSASRSCSPGTRRSGPVASASCCTERGAEAGWAEVGGDPRRRSAVRGRRPSSRRRRDPAARATRATPRGCGPTRSLRRCCSPSATSPRSKPPVWRSSAPAGAPGPAPGSRGSSAGSCRRQAWRSCRAWRSGSTAPSHRGVLDAGGRPIGVVGSRARRRLPRPPPRPVGARQRATACSSARRRWARAPRPGGSLPATGSSPGWPTSSSWSSPTPPVDRCTPCGRPPTARSR